MPMSEDTSSLQGKHVDLPPAVVERNIPPEIILQLIMVPVSTCVPKHNLLRKPHSYKQSNLLTELQNQFINGEAYEMYLTSLFMMETYDYYMKNWSTTFTDVLTLVCHFAHTSIKLRILL
jgi:hypothetical protein